MLCRTKPAATTFNSTAANKVTAFQSQQWIATTGNEIRLSSLSRKWQRQNNSFRLCLTFSPTRSTCLVLFQSSAFRLHEWISPSSVPLSVSLHLRRHGKNEAKPSFYQGLYIFELQTKRSSSKTLKAPKTQLKKRFSIQSSCSRKRSKCFISMTYADNFHEGVPFSGIQWSFCIWCALFVTSQFDVIIMFSNQRFGEVC